MHYSKFCLCHNQFNLNQFKGEKTANSSQFAATAIIIISTCYCRWSQIFKLQLLYSEFRKTHFFFFSSRGCLKVTELNKIISQAWYYFESYKRTILNSRAFCKKSQGPYFQNSKSSIIIWKTVWFKCKEAKSLPFLAVSMPLHNNETIFCIIYKSLLLQETVISFFFWSTHYTQKLQLEWGIIIYSDIG